jgi:hypothetical protein
MPIAPALLALALNSPLDETRAHVLENELVTRWGEAQRPRIARGIAQVRSLWRQEDGSADELSAFVKEHWLGDPAARQATFDRLEYVLEQVNGYLYETRRVLREASDLEIGALLPVDPLLGGYDASAHLTEDLFANKVAFVVLLNFPLTTLAERLDSGPHWSRQEWAEARLASRFRTRLPADVSLAIAGAEADGEAYIAGYNVWMHHLVTPDGARPWAKGLRLISHWNLRDDLKARYAEKDGLAKQRIIAKAMERIVTQTIPAAVVDDPRFDWEPFTNTVREAPAAEVEEGQRRPKPAGDLAAHEPDTRYAKLLAGFVANRRADAFSPSAPTLLARRFDEDREIPEARVQALFEQVLGSPLLPRLAKRIEKRLGRPLEPFDIWFNGFAPRGRYTEAELDARVVEGYPA